MSTNQAKYIYNLQIIKYTSDMTKLKKIDLTARDLSEVLKELRASKGVSQAAASEAAGVPIATLKNSEAGKFEPAYKTLVKLGQYYGVRWII